MRLLCLLALAALVAGCAPEAEFYCRCWGAGLLPAQTVARVLPGRAWTDWPDFRQQCRRACVEWNGVPVDGAKP